MRIRYSIFFFTLFFFLSFVNTLFGQPSSFDYEERPTFNFRFDEADINMEIDPKNGAIKGSVVYQLTSNMGPADTLHLDARGMEVDSVHSGGASANFTLNEDVLRIALSDSSEMGAQYNVEIFYHTTPSFGMLKSSEGSIWTSLLPRSNSHLIPVKDHPRVEMITTLSLKIPADYTAFASGVRTDNEVLSTSHKKVTFRTSRPIPITSLSFGIGKFKEKGSSIGIKRINSYAENGTMRETDQIDLVNKAKSVMEKIEQETGIEYPYQRLNIVSLNDHYWEQKPYGASTIFLYTNRGDWESQLRRGLYGQWFGVFQHEEQWAHSWPVFALQTALHHQLSKSTALEEANRAEPKTKFSTVYDQFSAERWNFWQQSKFWNSNAGQITGELMDQILEQGGGVITPNSFIDAWYSTTGQSAINMPEYNMQQPSGIRKANSDTVRYMVDYEINQSSNLLSLVFNAEQGSIKQPVTLSMKTMTSQGIDNAEITISGTSDSVSVSIPTGARGVYLEVPDGRAITLEEHKPVAYLLYQLRNGETTEVRRKAALGIGYHTDNPDLQLALNDVISQDMEPEVEAALLRSYGKITAGATGTQQRFLDALDSDDKSKRSMALDVLNNNFESPEITSRLRSFSQNESDDALSNRALNIYLQRADSSAALSFTNELVRQDTAGTRAIMAIEAIGNRGNSEQAVKLATYYLEPVYSYSVRKKALQVLLTNDASVENWKTRTQMLLSDFDPRIRYLAVNNIQDIPGIDANTVLQAHREQEYDARVLEAMNNN